MQTKNKITDLGKYLSYTVSWAKRKASKWIDWNPVQIKSYIIFPLDEVETLCNNLPKQSQKVYFQIFDIRNHTIHRRINWVIENKFLLFLLIWVKSIWNELVSIFQILLVSVRTKKCQLQIIEHFNWHKYTLVMPHYHDSTV